MFKVLDPTSFLADLKTEQLGIEPQKWKDVGAFGVVKYRVSPDAIEFRLFEVSTGNTAVLTKMYKRAGTTTRQLVHRWSNEVVKYYTGEPGFFGSKIAFTAKGSQTSAIYAMDFDGANAYAVSHNTSTNILPAWSPSGGLIAYTSFMRSNPDLYVGPAGGGRPKRISSQKGMNTGAAFSPDGSKIALTLSKDGNPEIYVISASDGSIIRRLTNDKAIDTSPAWSPDGSMIAFVSDRNGGPQIFVVPSGGGGARQVSFNGSYNTTPTWSPKPGKHIIAYTTRDGGSYDIVALDIDSKQMTRITQNEGNNEEPAFSPNGRAIAYARQGQGIFISNADGTGKATKVYSGARDRRRLGPGAEGFRQAMASRAPLATSSTAASGLLRVVTQAHRTERLQLDLPGQLGVGTRRGRRSAERGERAAPGRVERARAIRHQLCGDEIAIGPPVDDVHVRGLAVAEHAGEVAGLVGLGRGEDRRAARVARFRDERRRARAGLGDQRSFAGTRRPAGEPVGRQLRDGHPTELDRVRRHRKPIALERRDLCVVGVEARRAVALVGTAGRIVAVEVIDLDRREHDQIRLALFHGVVDRVRRRDEPSRRRGTLLEEQIHFDRDVEPARVVLRDHPRDVTLVGELVGRRIGGGREVVAARGPTFLRAEVAAAVDRGLRCEVIAAAVQHRDRQEHRLARRGGGSDLVHLRDPRGRQRGVRRERIPRDAVILLVDVDHVDVVREIGGCDLQTDRGAGDEQLHAARGEQHRRGRGIGGGIGGVRIDGVGCIGRSVVISTAAAVADHAARRDDEKPDTREHVGSSLQASSLQRRGASRRGRSQALDPRVALRRRWRCAHDLEPQVGRRCWARRCVGDQAPAITARRVVAAGQRRRAIAIAVEHRAQRLEPGRVAGVDQLGGEARITDQLPRGGADRGERQREIGVAHRLGRAPPGEAGCELHDPDRRICDLVAVGAGEQARVLERREREQHASRRRQRHHDRCRIADDVRHHHHPRVGLEAREVLGVNGATSSTYGESVRA